MYRVVKTPHFYHYRSYYRHKESDRDWIESRMKHIPPQHQKRVSERYVNIFLSKKGSASRKEANEYLQAEAKKFYEENKLNNGE